MPERRFPEFQGAGEWEEEKLDDLVHFQDGFAFKSADFVKSEKDGTQVIRITDINNKNSNADKVYIPDSLLELNNLDKYFVNYGDLLLSLTGAAGFNFFFWNGGRAVINQRTAKITTKKKTNYALARLLEPLVHGKINARGEGQNNNLSKEFLSSIVLLIPEPGEQQKIADCLTSIDELITAQTQKLDTLKTHKKGLMQQLFPAEGETVPKLRFPEFRDKGEWERKPIGNVLTEQSRPIDMQDDQEYSLVTVKRRYGGIVSRGVFPGRSIKVKSQFLLKENDFLISKRQIVHCACGVLPKDLEGSIVSNEYSVLVPKKNNDIHFFNYFSQ